MLFVLLLASPFASPNTASAVEQPKKVLIFFSEDMNRPAAITLNQSIRSALKSGLADQVDITGEYLDNVRFPISAYALELVSLLRKKYEGVKFDLVLLVGTHLGLQVLLNDPERVFPDTPIVFLTTDMSEVADIDLRPSVTGVWFARELGPTLELALALQPDTRRVVVVAGVGVFDTFWMAKAQSDFHRYEDRIEFTYLSGLPLAELREELGRLPKHTLVLHTNITRVSDGHSYYDQEALSRIAQASAVPIYGTLDTQLGSGIVGGKISSFEDLGKEGAEVGLRILAGEKPQAIAAHGNLVV
jgi:hypothetical protein